MRKLVLCIVCLAAMMAGTGLKAQEVTIVLMPGYTWISIPTTDTLDFGTALGSFTPAVGDMIKSRWGAATFRSDGQWRGSISEFYPGYGYHYYSNRNVPVLLTFNAQQPASQVQVTTSEPMLITAISAMGGGEVTTNDGTYILVKGLCWAAHENPTTNDDFYQEAESGVGSFALSMTGLNIGTTYYVRAYAVTANGTVYGDQKAFTTRNGIPTLTTTEITNIGGASATSGGNITDDGGLDVLERGVCWSTMPCPTLYDSHSHNGTGVGSFTSSVLALNVSTTYYVRAYATTNAGTAYGNLVSFTTRDGIPTLTTSEIIDITGTSAKGGGNITDDGGLSITGRGICWSTSPNPTISDSHNNAWMGSNNYTCSITGLDVGTTYYVRAYAITDAGMAYGNEVSFTTRDGIPTLTTNDITNITAISATSGGNITDNGGLNVTAKGVCWSTSPNPTISDSHTTNGTGVSGFSSSITGLEIGTTYYVRAYATTFAGTGYGEEKTFTTRNGIPTVTTAEVTNVEGTYANGGGNITDDGGLAVTARGVCWSTSPSPTLSNSHTTNGNGAGSFSSYMTGLTMSTTYYVRAYATNTFVTVFGNQLSFTITNDDHTYVDLGLPSGLLWATCNVGADSPEEYGDYFAWGETQPKDIYDWSNYQLCNSNEYTLTKYCNKSNYGYNGFTDDLTTLLPEDDAATANWGSDWRMPTWEDWQELYNNTTCNWTTQNGVYGQVFISSNGCSLFLPAAGSCVHYYWSNSLNTLTPSVAWCFYFYSGFYSMDSGVYRSSGQSVRAVCSSGQNTYYINATASPSEGGTVTGGGTYQEGQSCTVTATANAGYTFINWTENGEVVSTDATYSFTVEADRAMVANFAVSSGGSHTYVDLGLPSGLLWATCNVGADSPEDYGDYFAWSETQPKDTYNWSTYQYCNGSNNTLTKYCNNSSYGYNGFTDNLTTLLPEDDAATANWGSDWRMPTKEEWLELRNNTTNIWTTQNGVNGMLFTASNGNSLFLPAAGGRWEGGPNLVGLNGTYLSSSLDTYYPFRAWDLDFNSGYTSVSSVYRGGGCSVRPVLEH